MKKLLNRVVCSTVIIAIVFSLGACQPKKPKSTNEKSGTTVTNSNFNPTGLPIVKEPVTLRVMTPHPQIAKKNYSEKEFYKKISEETNVKISWEEIAATSFQEKVNLAVNSGDLPDAIYNGGVPNFASAIEAGYVVALDEYINQFAPNQKKLNQLFPVTKAHATYSVDGKQYVYSGLGYKPEASLRAPLFMNKAWLDTLGLKAPTTTSELYDVLKAFKTKDPNGNGKADEIPLSFDKNTDIFYDMFGAWGMVEVKNKFHTTIKNGKMEFNPYNPKYKDALMYFHKLYSEGLIDAEFLTQDQNQVKAKASQKPTLIGAFTGFDDSKAVANASQFTVIPPLTGPFGDRMWPYNPGELSGYNGLIVFKNCKYPEVAIRWVDHLNDGVNAIINGYGPENLAWKRDESNKTWYTTDAELLKQNLTLEDVRQSEATQNGPEMTKVTEITGYKFVATPGSREDSKTKWSEMYKPFFNKEFWPNAMPIAKVSDESKDITLLQTDYENYFNTFVAESIIKGLDDAKWEAFQKKSKEMQVDKIVAFYQKQLDEYNKVQGKK